MKTIFFLIFSLAFWQSKILMKRCIELYIFQIDGKNLWNNINYLGITE